MTARSPRHPATCWLRRDRSSSPFELLVPPAPPSWPAPVMAVLTGVGPAMTLALRSLVLLRFVWLRRAALRGRGSLPAGCLPLGIGYMVRKAVPWPRPPVAGILAGIMASALARLAVPQPGPSRSGPGRYKGWRLPIATPRLLRR